MIIELEKRSEKYFTRQGILFSIALVRIQTGLKGFYAYVPTPAYLFPDGASNFEALYLPSRPNRQGTPDIQGKLMTG